jgi:hypothetical protein
MVARQTSSRRGVRVLGILVACVVGFAVMSASAGAATARFTGQFNPVRLATVRHAGDGPGHHARPRRRWTVVTGLPGTSPR